MSDELRQKLIRVNSEKKFNISDKTKTLSVWMAGIPVAVAIALYIIRPQRILYVENEKMKVSYKQLLIYTLIISPIVLAICYFYGKFNI